jgi:hypothetical protein
MIQVKTVRRLNVNPLLIAALILFRGVPMENDWPLDRKVQKQFKFGIRSQVR